MVTLFAKPESNKSLTTTPPTQEADIVSQLLPLSSYSETFLQELDKMAKVYSHGGDTVRVSEVLGSIAHLYERIRNVVEYKGEHVLRRNAIERILKRLLWEHAGHDTERIAAILIRELIWARYVPNDAFPKSKVKEIAQIVGKYLFFIGLLTEKGVAISGNKLREWIWGVASCEIEEVIDPANREPYVELMYAWFTQYFTWQDEALSMHEKELQIYLAIHRALTKSDDEIMRYHLLLKEYPQWGLADDKVVRVAAGNFFRIYEEVEKHLDYSDRYSLFRIIKRHTAPFEVLRELVNEEGSGAKVILQNQEKFEWKVREICQKKYALIQKKVNRGIIRSILYIFVTKVVFALLLEVPYEMYRFGSLTLLPLGINVVVPPSMMMLIGLTIRAPGENNTQRIISKLKTVIYPSANIVPTPFSVIKVKRGSILANAFTLIYLILFLAVFGGITWLLFRLHFTWVGIAVFFAFLSLVLLFGFRVRYTATELRVTSDRESLFGHLFNNLTLPFLNTGVYLSKGLARLNFFTIILDFLIEAPLKTIIEVVEEWTSFIREKREEVVEVPEQ